MSGTTHGALVRGVGGVVGKVVGIEYRLHGISGTLIGGCEDGADAGNMSVVVLDGLNSRLSSISRGDGCRQNENVLSLNHW